MKVNEPTVGPILGVTTSETARIFIRARLDIVDGRPRRAHGAVRWRKRGDDHFGSPKYFRLNPTFDMTGVVELTGLLDSTEYEYQVGWFYSEVATEQLDVAGVLEWETAAAMTFRTASGSSTAPRSFVFGSCRYVLRMAGGCLFDERGDKTFRSILRQKNDAPEKRTDALLMVGDQIYADDLRGLGADVSVDDYLKRYRQVFTTESLRALMGQVPTYMTLDDHEIEDNWPEAAKSRDILVKYPAAMHAYQTYQMSHSPSMPMVGGRLEGTPERFWYQFRDGCADFFMMDTRTERVLGQTMIGDEQCDALKAFLDDGSGRIKFIGSSVPFFGDPSADKWTGYQEQRKEILDFIRVKNISKVVFLSGDVHASFSSVLKCSVDPSFQVLSIVSSAFFWPYPHPRKRRFMKEGELKGAQEYFVHERSEVINKENFTRVSCSPTDIKVEVFGRKGKALSSQQYSI